MESQESGAHQKLTRSLCLVADNRPVHRWELSNGPKFSLVLPRTAALVGLRNLSLRFGHARACSLYDSCKTAGQFTNTIRFVQQHRFFGN